MRGGERGEVRRRSHRLKRSIVRVQCISVWKPAHLPRHLELVHISRELRLEIAEEGEQSLPVVGL